jgi:acyl-[acyl-carrier-protein]-phospholipid O-acyltransferase/long-chain-fatty-acid--[acyl-carrier-protein] ligase
MGKDYTHRISVTMQILHPDRIPSTGTLVVPGRADATILALLEKTFHGRKITWVIEESTTPDPASSVVLKRSGSGASFDAKDTAPAAIGKQLKSALEGNGVLIFVPGKALCRIGNPCHIPLAHLRALCKFGLPILPVAADLPREARLSIEKPSSLPACTLSFGKEIPLGTATPALFLEQLLDAQSDAYSQRPLLHESLASAVLHGIKKHGSRIRLFDGSDDSELRYDHILAAAIAFSKYLALESDAQRIGIVLPPGKGAVIANLAVLFAGKTPVNINFTAGHEAIRSSMRQAELERYITADPFVRKISSFPWPANRDLILIERVLPTLRKQIRKWAVLSKILPTSILTRILGLSKRSGDDEAVLLFTSGSSGDPKGVLLSHRNILANVQQFGSRVGIPSGGSILGALPLFHSFGTTVTLWYPLIAGIHLITYPNALDTKRLAELIAHHQVNILLSTPTFLRGYMKRVEPAMLASLDLVVTGAEKLPTNLADSFEERFGIRPQEGYGLTETSPATNVNLPDPAPQENLPIIPSARAGSVGQLLPGIAARLTDPATDSPIPLDHQGIIWLKGANIFSGYLNNAKKTADVLEDGWFRTGDVGRMDDEGFLYIEGRITRFSKIGGEMVPHETVEAAVNKVLGLDGESERRVAVVGIPDEQKGEVIVLLSTIAGQALEQECIDLRYKLLDAGVPSLWCPKMIIPVPEIPLLASGKLDIKACESAARR